MNESKVWKFSFSVRICNFSTSFSTSLGVSFGNNRLL